MKFISAFLLIVFGGAMLYAIGLQLWPIVHPRIIEIALVAYLFLALIELIRGSAESYALWSEATSRLSGGLYRRILFAVARARMGKINAARILISIISDALAHALAWPLPALCRRLRKSQSSKPINEAPALLFVALFEFWSLTAKAFTAVLLCLLTYGIIAATSNGSDERAVPLLFSVFAAFGSLTLLSLAIYPIDIATRLRQQPSNPHIPVIILFISLGTTLVLSFYAISNPKDLTNVKALINAGKLLLKGFDIFDLEKTPSWSALSIWKLSSAALFSTVIVQTIVQTKSLRRRDEDFLSLAQKYSSIFEFSIARSYLSKITSITPGHQMVAAILEYRAKNIAGAKKALSHSIQLSMQGLPRELRAEEIQWLSVTTHISTHEIPISIVANEVGDFLKTTPRPMLCIALSDSLYMSGRMSAAEIRKIFIAATKEAQAAAEIIICMLEKQLNAALVALKNIPADSISNWPPADRAIIACINLILNLSILPTEIAQNNFIHEWCLSHALKIEDEIRQVIALDEIFNIVICSQYLTLASVILTEAAPVDAARLKSLVDRCTDFLSTFEQGKLLTQISKAAYSQLTSGFSDHGIT